METPKNTASIFTQGQNAPENYFTGNVRLNVLVPKDETEKYTIVNVEFSAGGRTNWHTHPAGQILLVTHGIGIYQEKGKPSQKLFSGDVLVIPSHIEHWHGASKDSNFTHIAVTNIVENAHADWLNPVTEEEYLTAH